MDLAGARIAQAKKSARAGEHRADGKSLRGVNSKGGGNFAPGAVSSRARWADGSSRTRSGAQHLDTNAEVRRHCG